MTDVTEQTNPPPVDPTNMATFERSIDDMITTTMRRTIALCSSVGIPAEHLFDAVAPHSEPLAIARRLLGDLDMLRERLRAEGVLANAGPDGQPVALSTDDTPEGL